MADKVHQIHSLPDDAPWSGGLPPEGSDEHPMFIRALDRVLAIQRPVVLAHVRSIRLRQPNATSTQIIRTLERRYLAAVTTGGAAVGATAVIPGIGTGVTLALSGVETIGFLEATTLFAQSVAEVHGIPVSDPNRARALVLMLLLGQEGIDLVSQLANQATGRGPTRSTYWGEMVTKTIPKAAMGPLVDRLKTTFVRQFAAKGGASWIGKALPFGIGAAIGGTGNHILGRRVLAGSRRAFGIPPQALPPETAPLPGARRLEHSAVSAVRRAGSAVGSGVSRGASVIGSGVSKGTTAIGGAARSITRRPDKDSGAQATDAAPD